MASIDLKDAYLLVTILENHWKYLLLQWQGSRYEFCCLIFGLSSAPCDFTKLMKPVLAKLRQQEVHLIIYLDNKLVMTQSREEFGRQLAQITVLLESCFLDFGRSCAFAGTHMYDPQGKYILLNKVGIYPLKSHSKSQPF